MSEKTHKPSAQRLREARKKGQIPKSKLLTSAAVTLGGLMGTLAFAGETASAPAPGGRRRFSRRGRPERGAVRRALALRALGRWDSSGAFIAALASQVALAGLQVNVEP